MPIDFLTAAERERLNRFPEPIPDDDLRVFFTLSDEDQLEVGKQRGAHNQLGFALQLCALRYLGFAPMTSVPRRGLPSSLWRDSSRCPQRRSKTMATGSKRAPRTSSKSRRIWASAPPCRWISRL